MEPQPIGVCVIVLDKDQRQILLGKRLNSYKAGMYGLPGGRVDLTEPLEDCGKRELGEETGLKAHLLKYIGVVRELQNGYSFIHFAYKCGDYSGEPEVIEPDKCEKWEWFSIEDLPDNILPGHKAALDLFMNPKTITLRDI